VDTGRARANWRVNLDAPLSGTTPATDPSGQAAISQGQGVIAGFDPSHNREIHITNNLDYIEPLNNGTSAQAPAGFVEKAVQSGAAAARKLKVLS